MSVKMFNSPFRDEKNNQEMLDLKKSALNTKLFSEVSLLLLSFPDLFYSKSYN